MDSLNLIWDPNQSMILFENVLVYETDLLINQKQIQPNIK